MLPMTVASSLMISSAFCSFLPSPLSRCSILTENSLSTPNRPEPACASAVAVDAGAVYMAAEAPSGTDGSGGAADSPLRTRLDGGCSVLPVDRRDEALIIFGRVMAARWDDDSGELGGDWPSIASMSTSSAFSTSPSGAFLILVRISRISLSRLARNWRQFSQHHWHMTKWMTSVSSKRSHTSAAVPGFVLPGVDSTTLILSIIKSFALMLIQSVWPFSTSKE